MFKDIDGDNEIFFPLNEEVDIKDSFVGDPDRLKTILFTIL